MVSLYARPKVRVFGRKRGATIRLLYSEGCNLSEILAYMGGTRNQVRVTLGRQA